jgi:crotonobetainyl-CoA:carnitine CoA-transferase CaiB-like acyl-CoA transferase
MKQRSIARPLAGVQVLDLSRAVAGPFCTLILADLGARVIKIEEPESGDETRHWGPPFIHGESAYFLSLNRNKESVVLDLKHPSGRNALRKLIAKSDVLIQNFRPGVAERLGIDYEAVKLENPRLVYASVSGFGLTGPDRYRAGYDLIVQAMSGMMLASGADGEPAKACFPVADVLAAQFASQGIMAALYDREQHGCGTHVEVSLLESLLFAMSLHSTAWLLTGQNPEPQGTTQSSIVPYQLLHCQDKQLAVGVPNQRIWSRFCRALGRPDWAEDDRYRTNRDRCENRSSLIAEVEAIMRQRPAAEWVRTLDQYQVPCGPLLSVGEILESPQVTARENIVEVDHSLAGVVRLLANPMRYSNGPFEYRPPPVLGQDTRRVLAEFDDDTVAESPDGRVASQ